MSSPASFEAVRTKWIPEITHFAPGVPWVLVATKIDLRADEAVNAKLREQNLAPITTEQGQVRVLTRVCVCGASE